MLSSLSTEERSGEVSSVEAMSAGWSGVTLGGATLGGATLGGATLGGATLGGAMSADDVPRSFHCVLAPCCLMAARDLHGVALPAHVA